MKGDKGNFSPKLQFGAPKKYQLRKPGSSDGDKYYGIIRPTIFLKRFVNFF